MKLQPRYHRIRKWVILPCCLLVFGVVEELLYYKAEMVPDPYLRTALNMFLFVAGVSLIAYVLVPAIERVVGQVHRTMRRSSGFTGEVLIVGLLLMGVYWLWYALFVHGPESLLPVFLHNPG